MITAQTQKLVSQFQKSKISLEDRNALLSAILNKLQALPIDDVVVVTKDGNVLINNKKLEIGQAMHFKESCMALKENKARQVFHDQIKFLAINMGVHQGLNTEMIMFCKAALWCLQQEDELLNKFV